MIYIEFIVDTRQKIHSVEMMGHAGYADSGYDIVCAAVSSQVISVENSLHQLLNIPVEVSIDDIEGGYLKLTLPSIEQKQLAHDAQLLMKHLRFALEVTAESYPEYIKIKSKHI